MTVDALHRQSKVTAADLMIAAKLEVDQLFDKGFAEQHPELVVAFMRVAAYDLRTMLMYQRRTEEEL